MEFDLKNSILKIDTFSPLEKIHKKFEKSLKNLTRNRNEGRGLAKFDVKWIQKNLDSSTWTHEKRF